MKYECPKKCNDWYYCKAEEKVTVNAYYNADGELEECHAYSGSHQIIQTLSEPKCHNCDSFMLEVKS